MGMEPDKMMDWKPEIMTDAAPADLVAAVSPDEAAEINDALARPDVYGVVLFKPDNTPARAVVLGPDDGGVVMIYYARCFVPGLGPVMMKSVLGAAQVTGAPLRVATSKVEAMKKLIGAKLGIEAVDADGVPQGVFL